MYNFRKNKIFELHHIASFIEGDQFLKPDEIIRHISQLQKSKRIDETPCEVKLDNKGLRVKIKDTKVNFYYNKFRKLSNFLNGTL